MNDERGTIYLDHAATTPLRAEVLEAMLPALLAIWGNASSAYEPGRQARTMLDDARATVAAELGAAASEIVFTGSGSEADNLAVAGAALAAEGKRHIITTAIEHHAVLRTCSYLAERFGFDVTYLPVDRFGLVLPEAVVAALRPDTALVSVMTANNEVGTIEPVAEIGRLVRERGVLMHTDAVQAAGTMPLDIPSLNVDLLSISAHKFGGPKGVGALYIRRGVPLDPVIHGGEQEFGLRAGTENVANAVGLATALRLAAQERSSVVPRLLTLRDQLIAGIAREAPGAILTGHPSQRLPGHASFCFRHVEGESILIELDTRGICASAGAACSAGSTEPSHVIQALGLDLSYVRGAVRFTIGNENDRTDIDTAVASLAAILAELQMLAA